jgi:hypothetical protein
MVPELSEFKDFERISTNARPCQRRKDSASPEVLPDSGGRVSRSAGDV